MTRRGLGTFRAIALLVLLGGGVLAASAPVDAKGPIDKITVEGSSIPETIEVIDGESLSEFNPWVGRFLGDVVAEPDTAGEVLRVTMYLADASGALQPVYRFDYYPVEGLIYLPGPGDAEYETNKQTILSSNDGAWHEATAEWIAFVAAESRVTPPSTGDAGLR
jgi:hypothetical protein